MNVPFALRLLLVAGLSAPIVAACGGGSNATSPTATTQAAAPPATAVAEATATATSAPAAATPSATSPSPTAVATEAPSATPSGDDRAIAVEGSPEFIEWTQAALELIATKAPEWYEQVTASIATILSVPAGSGMNVQTKTYKVGEITAYAPGFSEDLQLIWYAGTIVHDSCHSELHENGLEYHGKNAEVACLTDQKAALELLGASTYFLDYVQGFIDGADDPANSYWTNPNRHW